MDDDLEFIETEHGVNLYSAGPNRFAYRSPRTGQAFYFADGRVSVRRMALMSALLDIDLAHYFRSALPPIGWLALIDYRDRTVTFSLGDDPQRTAEWLREQLTGVLN